MPWPLGHCLTLHVASVVEVIHRTQNGEGVERLVDGGEVASRDLASRNGVDGCQVAATRASVPAAAALMTVTLGYGAPKNVVMQQS